MNKIQAPSLLLSTFRFLRATFYVLLTFPLAAFADTHTITVFTDTSTDLNFTTLANKFSGIANVIIPFLIGVAFVIIVWGIFKYILHAGDSEQVAKGRMYIVYGVIALFLMLSFWGFVTMIHTSLFGS